MKLDWSTRAASARILLAAPGVAEEPLRDDHQVDPAEAPEGARHERVEPGGVVEVGRGLLGQRSASHLGVGGHRREPVAVSPHQEQLRVLGGEQPDGLLRHGAGRAEDDDLPDRAHAFTLRQNDEEKAGSSWAVKRGSTSANWRRNCSPDMWASLAG